MTGDMRRGRVINVTGFGFQAFMTLRQFDEEIINAGEFGDLTMMESAVNQMVHKQTGVINGGDGHPTAYVEFYVDPDDTPELLRQWEEFKSTFEEAT